MKSRVLLLGKRKRILKKLSAALIEEGMDCTEVVHKITDASLYFSNGGYDLVAFGRGIPRFDKEHLKGAFLKQNPNMLFVDGMAPVSDLLIAQIKHALAVGAGMTHDFYLQSFEEKDRELEMKFRVSHPVTLHADFYRLNLFYKARKDTTRFEIAEAGQHTVILHALFSGKKRPEFMVVRHDHLVLAVQRLIAR